MGQKDPVLEEEVKFRYDSVILHYRKSFIQDNAQRYIFILLSFLWIFFEFVVMFHLFETYNIKKESIHSYIVTN